MASHFLRVLTVKALLHGLLSLLWAAPSIQSAAASQMIPLTGGNAIPDIGNVIDRYAPDLLPIEALYKDIHQHPELSHLELRTASVVAHELRSMGLDVHEHIGGYGVVGILRNGPGKTVLLRAELDALPIREQTGVPYASTAHMTDWWGVEQPVMHACGHDMHMASLIAAAQLLSNARETWSGTVIALFQPNEEHTGGAQAMVDDGLYNRQIIPKPDAVLAQHLSRMPEGTVSVRPGPVLVSADTVRVRMYASEGHPANPQIAVDMSVVASSVIVQLQELVSRLRDDAGEGAEGNEDGYASIFVEEFHAGWPGMDWISHVDLVLDVKAYNPAIRARLHDDISRIVHDASAASGAVRKPSISSTVRAPLTNNSEALAGGLHQTFAKYFGNYNILDDRPKHPCEDFSILATAVGAPYVFWFLGRVDRREWDEKERTGRLLDDIPVEHSPFNAPPVHTTLKNGMRALSIAALDILWG